MYNKHGEINVDYLNYENCYAGIIDSFSAFLTMGKPIFQDGLFLYYPLD